MEEHVQTVNKLLRESNAAGTEDLEEESEEEDADEWGGFPDRPNLDIVDHEEEYIDEDRYTTVTVESVLVSRDGLEKPVIDASDDEKESSEKAPESNTQKETRQPKKKKQKFRYESKFDRQITSRMQRAKGKSRK